MEIDGEIRMVEERARKNFDSLLWATVTVFQVCTTLASVQFISIYLRAKQSIKCI